jgi:hypothetical protein
MGVKTKSTVAVGSVTSPSPADSERFISMKAVCAITSCSRTSIYRVIAQNASTVGSRWQRLSGTVAAIARALSQRLSLVHSRGPRRPRLAQWVS